MTVTVLLAILADIVNQSLMSALHHPARTMEAALINSMIMHVNAWWDIQAQPVKLTLMNVVLIHVRMEAPVWMILTATAVSVRQDIQIQTVKWMSMNINQIHTKIMDLVMILSMAMYALVFLVIVEVIVKKILMNAIQILA